MTTRSASVMVLACLVSCANDVCEGLSADECDEEEVCRSVSAHRYNATNNCRMEREFVGCIDNPGGCDESVNFRVDGEGECWQFLNACIPDSFERDDDSCQRSTFGSMEDC
jgi:hypothetical protein